MGKASNKQRADSYQSKIAFQQMLESEISRTATERDLVIQGASYLPYRYPYLKSPIYLINKKSQ